VGNLLTTGSILAAFFAGGVALFAPCCIVFLLPSYLATAVKNRRWRLLPLTFVFAAGMALVLVPITVGVSLVAASIAKYHEVLYFLGGGAMIGLAAFALSGRMVSLPSFLHAPDPRRADTGTMFGLGVFSGIASSCCAPVLAGVMALSALSGSLAGASLLGVAYVFGMTFPLFVMALCWQRFHLDERRIFKARPVTIRFGSRRVVTNTVNVVVAVVFAAMGSFVIYLGQAGKMTGGPGFQVAVGRLLARVFGRILAWLRPVPEPILGLGLLVLVGVFVVAALTDRRTAIADPDDPPAPAPAPAAESADDQLDHSCH
jgi:cytochrome c-type biogenesis protein